jgi:hypothetical protein
MKSYRDIVKRKEMVDSPTVDRFTLSVVGEDESPAESQKRFMSVIFEDLDSALVEQELSDEELVRVRKSMTKRMLAPGSEVAMQCPGAEICPFSSSCELAKIGKEPMGKKCPYEENLFVEYLARAVSEYEVNPRTDHADMKFCNEIATLDILILRVDMQLSQIGNVDILGERMVTGKDTILGYEKVVHPLIETRKILSGQRDRIINLMVGDRKEKYKRQAALKLKDDSTISKKQSDLANKIINMNMEKEEEKKVDEPLSPDDLL